MKRKKKGTWLMTGGLLLIAAALFLGQFGQVGGAFGMAAANSNVHTVLQKSLGNGMAQAAGAASDQCHLADGVKQVLHRTFHFLLLPFSEKGFPRRGEAFGQI